MKIQMVVQGRGIFAGNLFHQQEHIGGMGKDADGLYVNLHRQLTVEETIDLLTMAKDFSKEKVKINYREDLVENTQSQ